jgi:hypothetical protein
MGYVVLALFHQVVGGRMFIRRMGEHFGDLGVHGIVFDVIGGAKSLFTISGVAT